MPHADADSPPAGSKPSRSMASTPWIFFVLVLSVLALVALAVQRLAPLSPESIQILEGFDLLVCVVFFVDFIVTLVRAERRWRYLVTWGWLDLLSAVPTVSSLRWARSARIIRIFRLLRALRAARLLASSFVGKRSASGLLGISLFGILLLAASSIAILQVEIEPNSNIRTAEDALWWSISTMTTVGYGDLYPVTSEGRFVASILMIAGIGLIGVLSGLFAALFVGPAEAKAENELERIRKELVELRGLLEQKR